MPSKSARAHAVTFGLVAALLAAAQDVRAADMAKTLHVALPVAETGFDPQAVSDTYSFTLIGAIFDLLYVYDYFARPVRMRWDCASRFSRTSGRNSTRCPRPASS